VARNKRRDGLDLVGAGARALDGAVQGACQLTKVEWLANHRIDEAQKTLA
jgi:hypothetical protein